CVGTKQRPSNGTIQRVQTKEFSEVARCRGRFGISQFQAARAKCLRFLCTGSPRGRRELVAREKAHRPCSTRRVLRQHPAFFPPGTTLEATPNRPYSIQSEEIAFLCA